MLGTISGEQQRLSTRSNIHVGTFHAAKQQLTNRHAKHGTAWLARDHAFAPLRLNIRTQPFDLRGFADTVDAFKGDEYTLHIHHCTLRRSQRYRCSLLRTAHRHRSCDARQLSLLAATPYVKGDEYALHIHHRAGTTAGRAYPSLAASHSTSAFTVVGVEPISLAIRVLAQPLSANSRTLARRSARA